jgi:hypothetical protein
MPPLLSFPYSLEMYTSFDMLKRLWKGGAIIREAPSFTQEQILLPLLLLLLRRRPPVTLDWDASKMRQHL